MQRAACCAPCSAPLATPAASLCPCTKLESLAIRQTAGSLLLGMPIKFVNHLDNKTVQDKNIPDVHATPNSLHYDLHCNPPPSAAASGIPPQSTHRPKRSVNMLGEIHEYQIKAIDFVMLMCCYSKLRLDVLLISWESTQKKKTKTDSTVFSAAPSCN